MSNRAEADRLALLASMKKTAATLTASAPIGVSHIATRSIVLDRLIPKLIGITIEGIKTNRSLRMLEVPITHDEFVNAGYSRDGFVIDVYSPIKGKVTKVFSVRLASKPDGRKYCGGCCDLVTWKRGTWEDRAMAHRASARSLDAMSLFDTWPVTDG